MARSARACRSSDIIEEGLWVHHPKMSEEEREQRVVRALTDVGLDPETRFRYPHEFSGGQRQRIALARAVVLEPTFVVLDEPTSALDMLIQSQMVDLLRDLQKRRDLTYLFISHDLRVVAALASRLMVMRNGKVVEEGAAAELFANPQTDYTRALFAAAFNLEAAPDRRGRAIEFEVSAHPACHHRLGPERLGPALPHARAAARHPALAGERRQSGERRLRLRVEAAARDACRLPQSEGGVLARRRRRRPA